MANLRTVRIPLLERVVLEELATQWQVTTDEALTRLIRQAARQEVVREPNTDQHTQHQGQTGNEQRTCRPRRGAKQ